MRVFVDANIFISDGRPPGRDVVGALMDLVQGERITVLSTDVTVDEVTKHFTEHDLRILGSLTRPSVRGLLSEVVGTALPDMTTQDLKEKIWNKNEELTRAMLNSLGASFLDFNQISPSSVLSDYSRGKGMFGRDLKKDQFPDAFILKILEKEAESAGPISVLTADKDFASAIPEGGLLTVVPSLTDLLERLHLPASISSAELASFVENRQEELQKLAYDELEDYTFLFSENAELYVELDSINQVELLDSDNFEIKEDEILVAGMAKVHFTVNYSGPDLATASYDSEDKRPIAWQTLEGEHGDDVQLAYTMTILINELGLPYQIETLSFLGDDRYLWLNLYETDFK